MFFTKKQKSSFSLKSMINTFIGNKGPNNRPNQNTYISFSSGYTPLSSTFDTYDSEFKNVSSPSSFIGNKLEISN